MPPKTRTGKGKAVARKNTIKRAVNRLKQPLELFNLLFAAFQSIDLTSYGENNVNGSKKYFRYVRTELIKQLENGTIQGFINNTYGLSSTPASHIVHRFLTYY